MSTVDEIKDAIRNLPPEPRQEVANWCTEYAEDEWDAQIEKDVRAGKFKELAEAAKKAHREGQTTPL